MEFELLAPGLEIEWLPVLEVSLDCHQCGKRLRTVGVVSQPSDAALLLRTVVGAEQLGKGETAICTPTGHSYPAALLKLESQRTGSMEQMRMVFEYRFQPFTATGGWLEGTDSGELPGWARVHFLTHCPNCKIPIEGSTQSNNSRPAVYSCPQCDLAHYRELDPPSFRLLDSE